MLLNVEHHIVKFMVVLFQTVYINSQKGTGAAVRIGLLLKEQMRKNFVK